MEQRIITLVVCTFRRYNLTRKVIQSLCNQTVEKDRYEVIVVENDEVPSDDFRRIIEEASEKINIRYLFESGIGLSNARNTGGKAAVTEYVGYIDDDAIAPDNYVEKCNEIISSKEPDIFGGPIYGLYDSDVPYWYKDDYGSTTNNGLSSYLTNEQYLSATSICFRRSLLQDLGWFDPSLGMSGKKIWYGEETLLQIEAWKQNKNLNVWFDQNLYIYHLISPQKMTLSGRILRSYKSGQSAAYLWLDEEKINLNQKRAPYVLVKTLVYFFVKGLPGLFLRSRTLYPYWQNYAFEILARYFASFGQEWQRTLDLMKHIWSAVKSKVPGRNQYHKIKRISVFYSQCATNIIRYCNNSFSREVAISFDDGPDLVTTPDILKVLDKHNVKANFFITGTMAEKNPEILRSINEMGHLIGNHGYQHIPVNSVTEKLMIRNFEQNEELIKQITGLDRILYCRPPYGRTSSGFYRWINRNRKLAVLWSLDSYDYRADRNAELLAFDLINSAHNGDIFLFHDTKIVNIEVLDLVIPELKRRGFDFIRIDDKFKQHGF